MICPYVEGGLAYQEALNMKASHASKLITST